MNSKTGFVTFILFSLLFSACQEEPDPTPLPESGYPTIYKPLTGTEWNERNTEFQKINIYEGLSLNEYGFVEGEISLNEDDSITAEYVTDVLEGIIQSYKYFLGIPTLESIELKDDLRIHIPGYTGGSATKIDHYFEVMKEYKKEDFWVEIKNYFDIQEYVLRQNTIQGKKFNGPFISFTFSKNEHTLKIEKNWFPETYIPANEVYTLNDVLAITCRFIEKRKGINLWESKHNFKTSKQFIIKNDNSNTEIHECWKMEIDEIFGINFLYIDTQTGEILSWCIGCVYC